MSKFVKNYGHLNQSIANTQFGINQIIEDFKSRNLNSFGLVNKNDLQEIIKDLSAVYDCKIDLDDFYKMANNESIKEKLKEDAKEKKIIDVISEILTRDEQYKRINIAFGKMGKDSAIKNYNWIAHSVHNVLKPSFLAEFMDSYEINAAMLKKMPVSVLIESATIIFNIAAFIYNEKNGTNVEWFTDEERALWNDALNGVQNEWSYVPQLIENVKEAFKRENYYILFNSEVSKFLLEVKAKRGRGLLNKGLSPTDDVFNFLINNGVNPLFKNELDIYFDAKVSSLDFYKRYRIKYFKNVFGDNVENIAVELTKKNTDANFRKLFNKAYFQYLYISIDSLRKIGDMDFQNYVNDTIFKIENLYHDRAMHLNVASYNHLIDAKSYAIKLLPNNKDFNNFYWIKENKNLAAIKVVEPTPLYIDEMPAIEQKKIKVAINKFYSKKNPNFEFKNSCCYIFSVSIHDVQDWHLKKHKKYIALSSLSLKVKKRFTKYENNPTVPVWVKNMRIISRADKMIFVCYVDYSTKDSEDVYENIIEDVILNACTSEFTLSRKITIGMFDLEFLEKKEDEALMKYDLKKSKEINKNTSINEKQIKVKKF